MDEVNAPLNLLARRLNWSEKKNEAGSRRSFWRPLALQRSVAQAPLPEAGLLTHRSSRPGNLPIPEGTVEFLADPLAAHSGATVRELHPLPFSLAVAGEHLEQFLWIAQWNETVKSKGDGKQGIGGWGKVLASLDSLVETRRERSELPFPIPHPPSPIPFSALSRSPFLRR